MKRLIISGKIVTNEVFTGSVIIEDGIIRDIVKGKCTLDGESYVSDGYVLPSFIELHAHGGAGYDFSDNSKESYDAILKEHLSHGVTHICPTLTSCPFDKLVRSIEFAYDYAHHPMFGGLHLEGPFLSPVMCGAQNKDCIYTPSAQMSDTIKAHAAIIKRITAAPEVEGVLEFAKKLLPCGVKMSIGHSNADADEFYKAKAVGFDCVTHLYSSTSTRHKKGSYVRGGIIEATLADDEIFIELIGDGHHVSRENIILTNKCASGRVCLVSDAMRAAGLSDDHTESYLGEILPENRVILEDGVAKLPDRSSFAGSLAVGDTMLRSMCENYRLPITTVSEMLSSSPAKLLGLSDRGRLAKGLAADITVTDNSYKTEAVFIGGVRKI